MQRHQRPLLLRWRGVPALIGVFILLLCLNGAASAQEARPSQRTISFEDGQLVHPTSGADAVIGLVELERDTPLAGQYSAHFANTDWGHLNVAFAPTDTLFVSFLIKPISTPDTKPRSSI